MRIDHVGDHHQVVDRGQAEILHPLLADLKVYIRRPLASGLLHEQAQSLLVEERYLVHLYLKELQLPLVEPLLLGLLAFAELFVLLV